MLNDLIILNTHYFTEIKINDDNDFELICSDNVNQR